MEKIVHRVIYAKAPDFADTLMVICALEADGQPDNTITFANEEYVRVGVYTTNSMTPEELFDSTREDVRAFNARADAQSEEHNQAADNESTSSTQSEARARAPRPQDQDDEWEDVPARPVSPVRDWRPQVYERNWVVPVYTGDEETDEFWEQENERRKRSYKLGLHKHVENLCSNAYYARQIREAIEENEATLKIIREKRDSLSVKFLEEDVIRGETLSTEPAESFIKRAYVALQKERERRTQNSKRTQNSSARNSWDRSEAARKHFLRDRARHCTSERIQKEKNNLDETREYRFYAALANIDREALPEIDRDKTLQRLLADKQFVMQRMQFEEHRRIKLLAKGEIYVLTIDEFIIMERMHGVRTENWTWETAIQKYHNYCILLGLITGLDEETERGYQCQREEWENEQIQRYNL